MAIELEYINVIVPVSLIRKRLGDDEFERCYSGGIDTLWCDGYLFREGCMNELDLDDMLKDWKDQGFELTETIDGQKHWKDVCVAYSHHGPSYSCNWLSYDKEKNIVWLKGHDPGKIIGPSDY